MALEGDVMRLVESLTRHLHRFLPLVSWPVLTLRVKKTTHVIFMCNNDIH